MEGVRRTRAAGIPLLGYTWWPLFDLASWTYRQGRRPLEDYLVPMGLWQLDPKTLDRVPTPLVDAYRDLLPARSRRWVRWRSWLTSTLLLAEAGSPVVLVTVCGSLASSKGPQAFRA